MVHFKNVLVPTDFSEASDAALAYGRAMARSFDASLTVLHVAGVVPVGIGEAGGKFDDIQREADETARAQVDALLTPADHRLLRAKATAVTSIEPARAIVRYAAETGADVIVMGTHGRSGMSHLLLGSVAESVVRWATCPVLVVKHEKRQASLPSDAR